MHSPIRHLIALACAALLAIMVGTPAASAADAITCEGTVVDYTQDRVLTANASNLQQITAAAESVAAHGPDVYIRAFENTPGGNADAFWAQGLKQCANWSSPDGRPKANVLVVTFGMDRTSGIFFNSDRYPGLQKRFDAIMAQDMNANFKGGDFADGIVAGLNSIEDTLQPSTSTGSTQGATINGSGILAGILWIAATVALIGLLVWIVMLVRGVLDRRRTAREHEQQRIIARDDARSAHALAAQLITDDKKSDASYVEDFELETINLPDSMTARHRATLDKLLRQRVEQSKAFARAASSDSTRVDDDSLSMNEFLSLQSTYEAITSTMKAFEGGLRSLTAAIKEDSFQLRPENRQRRWQAVVHECDQLQVELQQCRDYFTVDTTQRELDALYTDLRATKSLHDGTDTAKQSLESLELVEAAVSKLRTAVGQLAADRQTIRSATATFMTEIAARKVRLDRLDHVDVSKAQTSLQAVERRIDTAVAQLTPALSRSDQLNLIAQFVNSIQQTGHAEEKKNRRIQNEIDEERRRKEEERRRKEAAERRRREEEERAARRRRESMNSSFTGGVVGGAIGSSFGSSSSSSGGFGGGGSSWGGGGGFGGGGSSW